MSHTPSLTIRDASQDELDTISQVLLSAYGEYARRYTRKEWEGYRRNIADVRSRTGRGELIVAELQGRIVGAVTFYPIGSKSGDPWPQGWAGIRLLAVDAGARGIGAGRALMEECVASVPGARCRRPGPAHLGVHVGRQGDVRAHGVRTQTRVRLPPQTGLRDHGLQLGREKQGTLNLRPQPHAAEVRPLPGLTGTGARRPGLQWTSASVGY